MASPEEQSKEPFAQSDLARLTKAGSKVVRLSNTIENGPQDLQTKTAEFMALRDELRGDAVSNPDLTDVQKAAWFMALHEAEPGVKPSEIKRLVAEFSAQYQAVDAALSKSDVLVMGYQQKESDHMPMFKTAGTGLKLGDIADYEQEGLLPGLYTRGTTPSGGEDYIRLNFEAAKNAVIYPEQATEVMGIAFGSYKSRLAIGEDTIVTLLAGNMKYHGLPMHNLRQARDLGVRLEELDPEIKEWFESRRQADIRSLAGEIYLADSEPNEHRIRRLKESFADILFLGGSIADVHLAVSDIEKDLHEKNENLLKVLTTAEVEKQPA